MLGAPRLRDKVSPRPHPQIAGVPPRRFATVNDVFYDVPCSPGEGEEGSIHSLGLEIIVFRRLPERSTASSTITEIEINAPLTFAFQAEEIIIGDSVSTNERSENHSLAATTSCYAFQLHNINWYP